MVLHSIGLVEFAIESHKFAIESHKFAIESHKFDGSIEFTIFKGNTILNNVFKQWSLYLFIYLNELNVK